MAGRNPGPSVSRQPTQAQRPSITLRGDRALASSFIPYANKFISMVQDQVNLGANLGQQVRHNFTIAPGITMEATVQPGVTNRLANVTITALPEEPEQEIPQLVQEFSRCPYPPFGRPGARLFLQLFGKDPDTGEWAIPEIPVERVAFNYTFPDLPNQDNTFYRGVATLPRPFPIFGALRSEVWLCGNMTVGWDGPFFDNVEEPDFVDAPCTRGVGNGFVTDTGFLGNENLKFILSAAASSFGVDYPRENGPKIYAGTVQEPTADGLIARDVVVFQYKGLATPGTKETNNRGEIPTGHPSIEIVLLYGRDGCSPYIGFFYGGSDSPHPDAEIDSTDYETDYPFGEGPSGYCGIVDINNLTTDRYTTTWVCESAVASCSELGSFGFSPPEANFMMTGEGNVGILYGAFRDSDDGSGYATPNLCGRTFWVEMDEQSGNPTGVVLVQATRAKQEEGEVFGSPEDIFIA